MDTAIKLLTAVPPLVFSVVVHEVAHGYTAWKLGDPTAKALGRITLNPIRHIDLMMTIILPGLLILSGSPVIFGGAKPVPVDPRYFKNPRRDMAIVALAGPLSNLLLAVCFFGITKFLAPHAFSLPLPQAVIGLFLVWCAYGVLINVALALFNLLPVPPLDGGRIVVGLLPYNLARAWSRLEPYGILIVFILLYSGVVGHILDPVIRLVAQDLLYE